MTVTSFYFFIFVAIGVIVYYIMPHRVQWVVLLGLSGIFYFMAAIPVTFLYLVSTVISIFVAGLCIEKNKSQIKVSKTITVIAVLINVLLWFVVKGAEFWILGVRVVRHFIPFSEQHIELVAALGMGYYTLQAIGYVLDVYWGIVEAEKNPFKLFVFISFFPQLVVGPISKYSQLKTLFQCHDFKYQNLCFGCQRILWGVLKKIVISDRLAIIVNSIWADPISFAGIWSWIAFFIYPLIIYTDFSGCADIVVGVAELFDIKLPENFNSPFLARSVQEFWQRWHVTLGAWARDYVYYPLLKTKMMVQIGTKTRKKFSKRISKFIPWALSMGVLWGIIGIWHGAPRYVVGVTAWFWIVIVLSELLKPLFGKMRIMLSIDTESFSWKLFQRFRTYILFSIGCAFFASDSVGIIIERFRILAQAFGRMNPWTLFDDTILKTGASWGDINLLMVSFLLIIIVGYLREKYGYARVWISKQILPFRWMIWFFLMMIVLVFGKYGPDFDASKFIYQGF